MRTPYLAFAKKSFLMRSAYRADHLMGIVNTIVRIFIFWEIYRSLYGSRTQVDGISMKMVTTNFILSIGLGAVFFVRNFYLPEKIRDGSIANELLLPLSFRGRMLADNFGNVLFNGLYHFIPALIVASIIMGILPPANMMSFLFFVGSSLLGYGVLWTISFLVQVTSFWLLNVWSLVTIKNFLLNILSGTMIPLWFLPDWMQKILDFTPFPSIYFTPVQIYLGQLSYKELFYKCMIQVVWIVVFVLLGDLLWKKGKKRLVVQGG